MIFHSSDRQKAVWSYGNCWAVESHFEWGKFSCTIQTNFLVLQFISHIFTYIYSLDAQDPHNTPPPERAQKPNPFPPRNPSTASNPSGRPNSGGQPTANRGSGEAGRSKSTLVKSNGV